MISFRLFNSHHFNLFLLLLFVQLSVGKWGRDPSYKLICYKGSKLIIGHDPREQDVECNSVFGLKQYCYRFVAHSPVHDIVKLGCASVLCSPFRNTCAEFEMGGVAGTLCCCNDVSYCNSASKQLTSILFPLSLAFLVYFLQGLF
ncbi:hypothetical protein M3Y97_00704000 [Aphelenchoides bicaudatus]|nr:hypothetical protein M3Y97_00704000 [Aphelenchoides bicaudatus]